MGPRELAILNIAVILGIAALYYVKVDTPPARISIADCPKNIGKYVEVRGIAVKVSADEKSTFITLSDENFEHRVYVFVEERIQVDPGAELIVRGMVVKYGNSQEIRVEDTRDLKILRRAYLADIPVLLSNPNKFEGLHVEVAGEVTFARMSYLNLTDDSGWIRGYLGGDYSGDRTAYFCGRVKNGTFQVDYASSKIDGSCPVVNVSDLKDLEGRICVHATIYDYGLMLYVSTRGYSIRVYCECSEIPSGNVVVRGAFLYSETRGYYYIQAESVEWNKVK